MLDSLLLLWSVAGTSGCELLELPTGHGLVSQQSARTSLVVRVKPSSTAEIYSRDLNILRPHPRSSSLFLAMPHATLPSPGFQALILCGPGASLDTFTSNPADFPKALLPLANRPMVWYPLDWCYRMGVSSTYVRGPPRDVAGR